MGGVTHPYAVDRRPSRGDCAARRGAAERARTAPGLPTDGGNAMAGSLPVLNLSEAKFECTFGRGCDGICCRNGRPCVYPEEVERLGANLGKFLPELRPEARVVVEHQGFLSRRRKLGL